jgi:threonine dehydrogenase-like Zn-dependent dehydrogenase
MRIHQAMLHGAGDLRIEEREIDLSNLAAGEAFVDTQVTALSTGTDLGNYEGRSSEVPGAPGYPRAVGYSNAGVVRCTGPQAAVRPGDRVFSMKPHQSGFVSCAADLLVGIPAGVSDEQASLVYLAQLGLSAMRQASYQAGEHLAVVGLGVIGLATVAVARATGARVSAIANSPLRLAAARAAGAHWAGLSEQEDVPRDVDLVILTANTWKAYRLSVEMVRYAGRVSVLGFPGRAQPAPDFNPLDPAWFYGKQLTLLGAGFSPRVECGPGEFRFNLRRNLEYILDLMARGDANLEPIISHRFPWHRMKDAYDLAAAHSKELTAAVFDWRAER